MEYEDLEELLTRYSDALLAEIGAQDELDQALANAYLEGRIDGKNAETRKAQEFDATRPSKMHADLMTVRRKVAETRISLTKAWLYSKAQA
jgi:hypothetical protein